MLTGQTYFFAGQVIAGKELEELVKIGRDGTTLILDEFYSWYQASLLHHSSTTSIEP